MRESSALTPGLQEKLAKLRDLIAKLDSCVVAYSGGVDSSLLAWLANDVLGNKALAVTFTSEFDIPGSIAAAEAFAKKHDIRQETYAIHLLNEPQIAANPADRCYYCKRKILHHAHNLAREREFSAVIEGQNTDDLDDYRPGRRAVQESGTFSPFVQANLSKVEIRTISRALGLETWNAPSSPCLATRIPYQQPITTDLLGRIGRAETFLRSLGIVDCRVRSHDDLARIEVPASDIDIVYQHKGQIVEAFTAIGFTYVTLGLAGYRRGSMNQTIDPYLGNSSEQS